jgi:hypothetical protein
MRWVERAPHVDDRAGIAAGEYRILDEEFEARRTD